MAPPAAKVLETPRLMSFHGSFAARNLSAMVLTDAEVGEWGGEGAEFNLYVYKYAM